jgi:cytochrome c-type biogenesis protein CcmH/NrfG
MRRGRRRARASGDADALVSASDAAAAAGDAPGAVALARDARSVRPGDGRLQFLLGDRLAQAGDRAGAAAVWVELLVCGAHGRPWHRHEIAGRLLRLAEAGAIAEVRRALDHPLACTAVDPQGLATYVTELRKRVAAAAGSR